MSPVLISISSSRRSSDSSNISCSSRCVLASRLAGERDSGQCSSFFTASQAARAAQPAAIGPTRPQPAGTRFRTRSFHLTAKGLSACSRGSLEALSRPVENQTKLFATSACCVRLYHVQMKLFLVRIWKIVYRCGLCGTAAFRLSYMPD